MRCGAAKDTEITMTRIMQLCLVASVLLLLPGCTSPPDHLSGGGTLAPCPNTPNCVSSEVPDKSIEPFYLKDSTAVGWQALLNLLESESEYTIVTKETNYVHAEVRTALMKFVDDVEFQLLPGEQRIAVRSASRLGFSDLGANKRRLKTIRTQLLELGVITNDDKYR